MKVLRLEMKFKFNHEAQNLQSCLEDAKLLAAEAEDQGLNDLIIPTEVPSNKNNMKTFDLLRT